MRHNVLAGQCLDEKADPLASPGSQRLLQLFGGERSTGRGRWRPGPSLLCAWGSSQVLDEVFRRRTALCTVGRAKDPERLRQRPEVPTCSFLPCHTMTGCVRSRLAESLLTRLGGRKALPST